MGLQKQVVTIDLGFGGLDQKTDPKRVVPTRLVRAENVAYRKTGALTKRLGFEKYDNTTTASGVTFGRLIDCSGDVVGVREYNQSVYAKYRDGTTLGAFTTVSGRIAIPKLEYSSIYSPLTTIGSIAMMQVSMARGASYSCFAINLGNTNGAVVVFADNATGNIESTPMALSGGTNSTQVEPLNRSNSPNSFAYGIGGGGNKLALGSIDYNTGTTTAVAFASAVTNPKFDMCAIGNNVFAVYQGTVTTSIYVAKYDVGAGTSTTVALTCGGVVTALAIAPRTNSIGVVACTTTSSTVKFAILDTSLNQTFTIASLTTTTTRCEYATLVSSPDETAWGVYFQTNNVISSNPTTRGIEALVFSNTATTITSYANGYGLALDSKASWPSGYSEPFVWTSFDTTTQQVAALVSGSLTNQLFAHNTVAMGGIGYGPPSPLRNSLMCLSSVVYDSTNRVIKKAIPKLIDLQVLASGTSYIYEAGVLDAYLDVSKIGSIDAAGTKLDGGILTALTNKGAPVPMTMLGYPELSNVSGVFNASGAKSLTGTYSVSAYFFEYTRDGDISRGPLAPPVTVSLSGTQNAVAVSITTYATRLGDLPGLAVVSTENAGTIYYNEQVSQYKKVLTIDGATLIASDTTLREAEPLYTTGGVLENFPAACPVAIATNGKRMIAATGARPNFVMISKEKRGGEGFCFMEDTGREIVANGAKIAALSCISDKWIAYKDRSIFAASGEGPDDSGQADTLSEFEPVSTDIGCINKRTVVNTRFGDFFVSRRGIYLLDSTLALTPIGVSVEDYSPSDFITGACNKDESTIHYLLTGGRLLTLTAFETEQGVEFRWASSTAASAGAWTDVITSAGATYGALSINASNFCVVKQRDPASSTPYLGEAGTGYSYTIETAWIPMGSIQGFGRLYELLVLGNQSDTNWAGSVEVAYDYESTWSTPKTITATNATLGSTNPQWRFQPDRQKCEAVRFRVTISDPTNAGTKGFELAQLQLVVGIKGNANKMRAGKQAT